MTDLHTAAAYGGPGWSPRATSLRKEIGTVWRECGVACEWSPLKAILLHQPGPELAEVGEPDKSQMLDSLDVDLARQQHDALAQTFREFGIAVYYIESAVIPPPNLMFVADLLFMTPEGVILGRPASTVRLRGNIRGHRFDVLEHAVPAGKSAPDRKSLPLSLMTRPRPSPGATVRADPGGSQGPEVRASPTF